MKYLLLTLMLLAAPVLADEIPKGSKCGGGYTDKNGVNWQWTGKYPNCCFMQFIDGGMLEEYKDNKFWVRNNAEEPKLKCVNDK